MSRLSYGEGMFSPIRSDATLNDDVFKVRESDIFSQWKELCVGENLAKNVEEFSKEISDEKKDNSIFATDNSLFVDNNISTCANSSKGKLSYITTRRKNSMQSKQTSPENPPKTVIKEVKTNRKKDSLSKYVSVRSEVSKGSELRSSKARQSSYATPSLPSLTEEQFGIKLLSSEKAHSSGIKNITPTTHCNLKKLSIVGDGKDANALVTLKELPSNESEIRNDKCLTAHCEVQTDLLMSELNSISGKILRDSASYNIQSSSALNPHISSKPHQIQANIIEKLVKDTVSFEFDGIRQMLYHHQWSLYRYMDKKFETEKENSSFLITYMESLMEENRRLREEVTVYQNFFNKV